MFLAGGVAFNILLAGVPFFLLLSAGLGYALDQSPDAATARVSEVLERLLPPRMAAGAGNLLDPVLADVVRTRGVAGISGALGFLWFSTRLFGSLRSVLVTVFQHGRDRGYFRGKLWDSYLTIASAILVTIWVSLTTWLAVSRGRAGSRLAALGVREDVMSGIEYFFGRVLALAVVCAIFFSLYRWLPKRRPAPRVALVGAVTASLLFECARYAFGAFVTAFPPGSLYTGTLGALVLVVFWTYYAALIFIIGATVAHVTAPPAPATPVTPAPPAVPTPPVPPATPSRDRSP